MGKRKRHSHAELKSRKKVRTDLIEDLSSSHHDSSRTNRLQDTAVLRACYPSVQTLRSYLVSKSSKRVRKAIANATESKDQSDASKQEFADLLDQTIVGSFDEVASKASNDVDIDAHTPKGYHSYSQEFKAFSQQISSGPLTVNGTSGIVTSSINDILDFTVATLFKRNSDRQYPQHILCYGFVHDNKRDLTGDLANGIMGRETGIKLSCPNPYLEQLGQSPWTRLPPLLGGGGRAEDLLINMFVNCGIFSPTRTNSVGEGSSNWIQISGIPVSELKCIDKNVVQAKIKDIPQPKLNSIQFARHRILYGRPIINRGKGWSFGLPSKHVLNQLNDPHNCSQTLNLLERVFPHQFGMPSIFRPLTVTALGLPKSAEHSRKRLQEKNNDKTAFREEKAKLITFTEQQLKIPKRLRGPVFDLIKAVRLRHKQCSYALLMQKYCPASQVNGWQENAHGILALATPVSFVVIFCQAIVKKVFPTSLWGSRENLNVILSYIDKFIGLGRYETMTLHSVCERIVLRDAKWLSGRVEVSDDKMSLSDWTKRKELFLELLYFLFDSFLIPLLSTNFYITEAYGQRNRLYFFRHDIWTQISKPSINELQKQMFEPIAVKDSKVTRFRCVNGAGKVRLVPKENGLRPIINLRRRVTSSSNGRIVMGKSINTAMQPAFSVLKLLKQQRPELLGCSIFSTDELLSHLQLYKRHLIDTNQYGNKQLYFASVDVKSCFDSIPQAKLLAMLQEYISSEHDYTLGRYSEGHLLRHHAHVFGSKTSSEQKSKLTWKFNSEAQSLSDSRKSLFELLCGSSSNIVNKSGRVYIDRVTRTYETSISILALLTEHISHSNISLPVNSLSTFSPTSNKIYRQKKGIAQGSIVSGLLCALFYGLLDRTELRFLLEDKDSCLVRLVDDFLLITTDREKAEQFVGKMHAGVVDFGVEVKEKKSKVNFDTRTSITKVPIMNVCNYTLEELTEPLQESENNNFGFPYCGLEIDTRTLELSVDHRRRIDNKDLKGAITVEHSRNPGRGFLKKSLDMVRLHLSPLLINTTHNSHDTVMKNLYIAFIDIAWRCMHYIDAMKTRPSETLLKHTIEQIIESSHRLIVKRNHILNKGQDKGVDKKELQSVAYKAFTEVFTRRQTKLRPLVGFIKDKSLKLKRIVEQRRIV